MKVLITVAVVLGLAILPVGSCLADISSVSGTGTTATLILPSTNSTVMDGFSFPTAVIGDSITSLSSQIAFTYTPPPDYNTGDRLIVEVINGTSAALSNFVFTLSPGLTNPASAPQYYDVCGGCNGPYQGVPSAGIYDSTFNTYTTTADLSGDVNPGKTVLSVPFTLGAGQEQDFYFAVNYTGPTPGNFILSQTATPEPGLYGALALGLSGLVAAIRRKRA